MIMNLLSVSCSEQMIDRRHNLISKLFFTCEKNCIRPVTHFGFFAWGLRSFFYWLQNFFLQPRLAIKNELKTFEKKHLVCNGPCMSNIDN